MTKVLELFKSVLESRVFIIWQTKTGGFAQKMSSWLKLKAIPQDQLGASAKNPLKSYTGTWTRHPEPLLRLCWGFLDLKLSKIHRRTSKLTDPKIKTIRRWNKCSGSIKTVSDLLCSFLKRTKMLKIPLGNNSPNQTQSVPLVIRELIATPLAEHRQQLFTAEGRNGRIKRGRREKIMDKEWMQNQNEEWRMMGSNQPPSRRGRKWGKREGGIWLNRNFLNYSLHGSHSKLLHLLQVV